MVFNSAQTTMERPQGSVVTTRMCARKTANMAQNHRCAGSFMKMHAQTEWRARIGCGEVWHSAVQNLGAGGAGSAALERRMWCGSSDLSAGVLHKFPLESYFTGCAVFYWHSFPLGKGGERTIQNNGSPCRLPELREEGKICVFGERDGPFWQPSGEVGRILFRRRPS